MSDHLTQGTVFLVICVVTGLLVELNYLWPTPNMQSYVSFGKLHLVAYTHLAMVGFILHTVFGVLSHLLVRASLMVAKDLGQVMSRAAG